MLPRAAVVDETGRCLGQASVPTPRGAEKIADAIAQAAVLARTVSDDPCLSRLLEDIQDEAQSHAAQIRVLLEELL